VPRAAAGSPHPREIALEWIDSSIGLIAAAGWGTLTSLVALKDDAEPDLAQLKRLLPRMQQGFTPRLTRCVTPMKGFVIAVGSYVQPLTALARQTG
jgi:hypothetical protein